MSTKIRLIKNRQRGFNLIEILVTVLITSVALVGLAGLQLSSVKNATFATFNTRAMLAIKEMAGHIKSDVTAAKTGLFDIDLTNGGGLAGFSALTPPTTGAALASRLKYTWFQNLNDAVPDAKAGINCSALGLCVIKVQFSDNENAYAQIITVQL